MLDSSAAAARRPGRRRAASVFAAVSLAAGVLNVATATSAFAATCSGYGCDGQNPYGAGCFSGSVVVDDRPLVNQFGQSAGRVRLHYSSACRTVWGSIYNAPSPDGTGQGWADIHRNSDNHRFDCAVPINQSSCYTAMLYDGGVTSHAHAEYSPGTIANTSATTIDY